MVSTRFIDHLSPRDEGLLIINPLNASRTLNQLDQTTAELLLLRHLSAHGSLLFGHLHRLPAPSTRPYKSAAPHHLAAMAPPSASLFHHSASHLPVEWRLRRSRHDQPVATRFRLLRGHPPDDLDLAAGLGRVRLRDWPRKAHVELPVAFDLRAHLKAELLDLPGTFAGHHVQGAQPATHHRVDRLEHCK